MSETPERIDYRSAGVDIEAGNEAVRRMKQHVSRTHSSAVLTSLGSFGSVFSLAEAVRDMTDPLMVQSTDGVGTKTKVTVMVGRYEDLGRDLVAAVAGDIAVMGARPLTFLDYLGLHKTDPGIVEALVRGMSDACAEADIALVGGETAEMPAVYAPGELDVVGFVTGVVDRAKLLTGTNISAGDMLYAINSSGLHTNGWSLARKLLFERAGYAIDATPPELGGSSLAEVLLAPHTNYVRPIRRILDAGLPIKGMAHITGGGVVENIPRILPSGLGAAIDRSTWTPQPIFGLMQTLGQIDTVEMHRVFNMGVGLVLIAQPGLQQELADVLTPFPHLRVWELGRVEAKREGVELVGAHDRSRHTACGYPHCLTQTDLPLPAKYPGKVRDTYDLGDGRLLLVTTDRQSGFDRMLGAIPFKGQVLNRTSLYWFEQTRHIVKNHVLSSPHANTLIARKCRVLPIEFVVRGYLTGSTDTSIWTQYEHGQRVFNGFSVADGMMKNERLPQNIITPTTKEKEHDRPILSTEILSEGWLTSGEWDICSRRALELFTFGQKLAAQRGLILVDTKYEFGVTDDGEILLIDEVHTPDSSRYWLAPSYEQHLSEGLEPEMIDKEFFRLWFRERCDPYRDKTLPTPPDELIAELASRYIQLFETITGELFVPDHRPLGATVMANFLETRLDE